MVDGGALRPLTFFDFFSLTRDDQAYQRLMSKRYFPVASLTPSVLGVTLGPVLARQRPLEQWNLPLRRALGDNVVLPGLADDAQRAELYVPFFVPFTKFFEPGALQRTLPRTGKTYRKGVFIFKVSLGRDRWRTIAVPSDCTLDDLHLAIQRAYHFDNDHLYAFFMDGKRWSSEAALYSPDCEEGPYATDDRIGELDLVPNLPFLYLFDFGDEWQFEVKLLEIRREPEGLTQPTLMESHGKAPPQYRHWDE